MSAHRIHVNITSISLMRMKRSDEANKKLAALRTALWHYSRKHLKYCKITYTARSNDYVVTATRFDEATIFKKTFAEAVRSANQVEYLYGLKDLDTRTNKL